MHTLVCIWHTPSPFLTGSGLLHAFEVCLLFASKLFYAFLTEYESFGSLFNEWLFKGWLLSKYYLPKQCVCMRSKDWCCRARDTPAIALAGSCRLRSTLAVVPVLFAHAVVETA
jgi:hypothetical protein